ncbi:MAG: queuosine precursor transporter [Phycisphaerales bacterium]|nr:queuosine precursor transporter [Phycisphaerales bacterium]
MPDFSTIPSNQHRYADLPVLSDEAIYRRREGVFLVLAGLFLGTLAMLNILGITRFITLFKLDFDGNPATAATVFAVAVGVLPYPLTFLCTDFISELYGRKRSSLLVWIGFVLNLWVMFILWAGGAMPGGEAHDPATGKIVLDAAGRLPVFYEVRRLAFGAVAASMIAYLAAQFVDVYVFHFWKDLTKNKHLWLRNNGSTLVSQMVDTVSVILITQYYNHALPPPPEGRSLTRHLLLFIGTSYAFKAIAALLDTIPFYIGAHHLTRYLRLPPPTHAPHPPAGAAVEAGVG